MMRSIALSLLFILVALESQSAIYGEDNRQLTLNHPNSTYAFKSSSVLSQLRKSSLENTNNQHWINSKPLKDHVTNLCSDAPFANTPTFSRCSAFLVTPKLIVTAGHCINNQQECSQATWAFTSELDQSQSRMPLEKRDIVTCKSLITHRKNSISKKDYALIEINEEILHRASLSIRKKGKVSNQSSLYVIGHPTGLPLIVTDDTQILDNSNKFLFKINSDTFGGNSGSPVFNSDTGIVEGILTDGDLDYTLDKKKGCMMPYICPEKGCKGENVVRITNIEKLAPDMEPLIEPIFNPRTPRL